MESRGILSTAYRAWQRTARPLNACEAAGRKRGGRDLLTFSMPINVSKKARPSTLGEVVRMCEILNQAISQLDDLPSIHEDEVKGESERGRCKGVPLQGPPLCTHGRCICN
mmetsp:Transcript_40574/g.105316  ORF Transcript_40574/g.105316 Transcript_40574/m.105316 type:complete len:111 (-) Transcript_40574:711-1043(-)